jgi:prefoldin subunit 5
MEISGGYGPNRQSRAFWGYIKSRTKNKTEKDMVHFKTGVCVNNSIREAIERFSNG